jgi:hypothetical protein
MTNTTLLSEPVVFPGHPLVIALIIMERFSNLADALDERDTGIARVLADPGVPGNSVSLDAAIGLLELGCAGTTLDELVRHADTLWRDASPGQLQQGLAQGNRFEALFRERASVWCAHQSSPAH